ncbi:MAG: ABC transporter ATP-binding protein [Planctomycetes bacterium]|nr:ABC transporter ATP-binding protein [Planctomycetota bacterium]
MDPTPSPTPVGPSADPRSVPPSPAAGEPVISTSGLTKLYRDFWGRPRHLALDRLDLRVERGEIFGFLGPNGAGKTTTMKLILGLIFPTGGSARVLGHDPRDVETKRRIGFLPEESYLYRFLTAAETLDFYGRLFSIPRRERKKKVDELLALVGLAQVRNRLVREFSKGMARRIGFAQALINDPEVVILDEPTSGLDPIVSRQMKDLILDLRRRGKTVFMSSHLLADIEDVCDRIAILFEGRLRKTGTVRDLLSIRDALEVRLKGVPADRVTLLKETLSKAGFDVANIAPPSDTLENLFLRTIRESREGESQS